MLLPRGVLALLPCWRQATQDALATKRHSVRALEAHEAYHVGKGAMVAVVMYQPMPSYITVSQGSDGKLATDGCSVVCLSVLLLA